MALATVPKYRVLNINQKHVSKMDPAVELDMSMMHRADAVNEAIARGNSDVQRFYDNSVVFVTGGTGFLGKQLIEKLFRSCRISKLYMLMRSKKGKNILQRLDDLLKEPVFESVLKQQPDFVGKIVPIEGDISELKLGLNDNDWKTLTEEVDVIFHVAATTKFDETIRVATLINVRGTREILALGKACTKLRSYVHVSTAYSHATTKMIEQEIHENFYKSPVPPETMISMAETMDNDRLISITHELIKNWPNTYTFTKSIAEDLIRTSSTGLPICVVRPAIVVCSYSEPTPGWLDVSCVYGATGVLVGTGLGVMHVLRTKQENILPIVPCDYVNNVIITAARETATSQTKGGSDTRIYTVSSTQKNSLKWGDLTHILYNRGYKYASPMSVYYSFMIQTKFKWIYTILLFFLQTIPAYIADFVCGLMGKEKRFAKLSQKVCKMSETLSYFLLNEWYFVDDNVLNLYKSLSKGDKAIFNFDITNVDWKEYVLSWALGCRKYILKDGLKDTKSAVKKQKFLRIFNYAFMSLYVYIIWKLVYFVYCLLSYVFLGLVNLI